MPSSQFEGLVRRTSSSDAPARRSAQRSADGSRAPTASSLISAGVAQLVERQPSKLNVAGSNPVSRSNGTLPMDLSVARPQSQVAAEVFGEHRSGAYLEYASTGAQSKHRPRPGSAGVVTGRHLAPVTAHLAQLVEHVLGKDEVTSSILVVGSKP